MIFKFSFFTVLVLGWSPISKLQAFCWFIGVWSLHRSPKCQQTTCSLPIQVVSLFPFYVSRFAFFSFCRLVLISLLLNFSLADLSAKKERMEQRWTSNDFLSLVISHYTDRLVMKNPKNASCSSGSCPTSSILDLRTEPTWTTQGYWIPFCCRDGVFIAFIDSIPSGLRVRDIMNWR